MKLVTVTQQQLESEGYVVGQDGARWVVQHGPSMAADPICGANAYGSGATAEDAWWSACHTIGGIRSRATITRKDAQAMEDHLDGHSPGDVG